MKGSSKRFAAMLVIAALMLCICGCDDQIGEIQSTPIPTNDGSRLSATNTDTTTAQLANVFDFTFTKRDTREKYDEARAIVELADGASTVNGDGVEIDGDVITFTGDGVYYISGALTNGKLIVNTTKEEKVQLILNGAAVHCNNGAAIEVWQADKVFITLASNTNNTLTDGTEYAATDIGSNACIFSKEDLTINGSGTLNVEGNFKHGISSKDDLVVALCSLNITAAGDGIRGKDCVKITGATISIEAQSDAIISDNIDDEWRGYVYIESGVINLSAGTDGIQAESVVLVEGGDINIVTGGGGKNAVQKTDDAIPGIGGHMGGQPPTDGMPDGTMPDGTPPPMDGTPDGTMPDGTPPAMPTTDGTPEGTMPDGTPPAMPAQATQTSANTSSSMKGIKAGIAINIEGGNINIDSEDDAIHSNGDVNFNNGNVIIQSGDDGIHAADALVINGGAIDIGYSYEGLEATNITINDGAIKIVATDDGMNAAGGKDSETVEGRPAQDSFLKDSGAFIKICGGYIHMDCSGDGIDSNGDFFMNGGVLLISGPTADNNAAIDYRGEGVVNGGVVVAIGSAGMAQSFDEKHSGQEFISYRLNENAQKGTVVTIKDSNGNAMLSFTGQKEFRSIVISCPEITAGASYEFFVGGTVEGADEFGFAYGNAITHNGGEGVGSITA